MLNCCKSIYKDILRAYIITRVYIGYDFIFHELDVICFKNKRNYVLMYGRRFE